MKRTYFLDQTEVTALLARHVATEIQASGFEGRATFDVDYKIVGDRIEAKVTVTPEEAK